MKLVPFSKQYLLIGEPLPFGLRDDSGRLLLGAGVEIRSDEQLQGLLSQTLYAEETEAADWNRRLAMAVNERLMQNATLKEVVAARPERQGKEVVAERHRTLDDDWTDTIQALDAALRDVRAGSDWRTRVDAAHARARALMQRRPDASLYLLVYRAGHNPAKYSSSHGTLVMLVCEMAAPLLGRSPQEMEALGRAALLMNVAMMRLQDQLAAAQTVLTPAARATISGHAEASAALLQSAGLVDTLVLDIVRRHHDADALGMPLAALAPAAALARLLRRVDIFTAKISCRATRAPMSPVLAAREACLGPDGRPDEIGGALLKTVGMYPPGSFVELASGEVGIVLARGRRANLPFVASLVSASGSPLGEPALRDTIEQKHAVKGAVPASAVRVRPPHERLLAMR